MSEKRFEILFYGDVINCVRDETGKEYNLQELISILMEQQATIIKLKELNDDKGKRIISLIRTNKTLKEENEHLKQEVFVYKKAFQEQVQRCTL